MNQQQRLLLAIALSFALTLLFTQLVWKPQVEPETARGAADSSNTKPIQVDKAATATATPQPSTVPTVVAVNEATQSDVPVVELPKRELTIARKTSTYVFSTDGAGLVSAQLQGRREREEQNLSILEGYQKLLGKQFAPPPYINLAQPIPDFGPQASVAIRGAHPLSATKRYTVAQETAEKIVFTTHEGPWKVTKTFAFSDTVTSERDPSAYLSNLEIQVQNVSDETASGELVISAVRAIVPENERAPSIFGGIGNQASVLCRHGEEVTRKAPSDSEPHEEKSGALHFIAIDQQYFLTALWPLFGAEQGKCALNASSTARSAKLLLPLEVAAGQTVTKSFGIFLGPKDNNLLQNVGKATAATKQTRAGFSPGLDKTVDFGWWAVICKGLIVFLRFFHSLFGNWGLAIIALTVMVKIVLLPLTHKAMVSAEQMKKLQPRLEIIRKKFPNDREKQNQEMMRLYQEAKVNPLGGCLPLLLQLPIWAALFTTLRTSYELYGEAFFGVWSDLTSKDPTYLMPIALGVTMIITQRLQPQMMDKSQALLMTWVMPVFFTAIMMNYPAGLSLYIFTNNLLSIAQQFALRKYLARKGQVPPNPAGAAK